MNVANGDRRLRDNSRGKNYGGNQCYHGYFEKLDLEDRVGGFTGFGADTETGARLKFGIPPAMAGA